MCVAVGGEDAYPAVFSDQTVAYWEDFLTLYDITEGVCCRGVDDLGETRTERIFWWGDCSGG